MAGTNSRCYTALEKKVFLEILKVYKDIIENKHSDMSSLKTKDTAWAKVVQEYNAAQSVTQQRTVQQLKKLWSNMKQHQRNQLSKEKQAHLSTGGGPPPEPAIVDLDIMVIAPHLMVTAPTLFSSNNTVTENEKCYELVFNGESNTLESSALEDEDMENELNEVHLVSEEEPPEFPPSSSPPASTSTAKRTKQSSFIGPRKKMKTNATKDFSNAETNICIQRLKTLIQQEKELHNAKFANEERLAQIREEAEAKIYELKIKQEELKLAEAAARLQIAELELKKLKSCP